MDEDHVWNDAPLDGFKTLFWTDTIPLNGINWGFFLVHSSSKQPTDAVESLVKFLGDLNIAINCDIAEVVFNHITVF